MDIKVTTISIKIDHFSLPLSKLPEERANTQLSLSSPQTTVAYVFANKQPAVEEIHRLAKCLFTGKEKPTDADLKKTEDCFTTHGWTAELVERTSVKNPEKGKRDMQDLFTYTVFPKT